MQFRPNSVFVILDTSLYLKYQSISRNNKLVKMFFQEKFIKSPSEKIFIILVYRLTIKIFF